MLHTSNPSQTLYEQEQRTQTEQNLQLAPSAWSRLQRSMRSALRPLALPVFRRLAFVRFVDELGDWLGEIALAVLVFDRTGSPMATAALFLALQFVPAFATPPLVARLEALPSRVALAGLNVVQAAVFAGLALLAPHFSLVAGGRARGRRQRPGDLGPQPCPAPPPRPPPSHTGCCAKETRCSTSGSPPERPQARRWPA